MTIKVLFLSYKVCKLFIYTQYIFITEKQNFYSLF